MISSVFVAVLAAAGVSNALAPPRHLSRAAADLQTSLNLDPSQVQPGLAQDGQAVPEAGQVPSLTSVNNFINFCATQDTTLTNGLQTTAGSCNPTIMGRILATTKLPSSKFTFPVNGGSVAANQTFTISMAINNMVTGNFVAAATNYYAAPCQVDGTGTVVGHSHVVVEKLDSLTQTTTTNPLNFAFFKGLNLAAVNGVLTATVTGGVAPGAYRLSSINTCANHQPVLASVAQHGHMDDMIYFTATDSGSGASGSGSLAAAGGNGGNGGKGNDKGNTDTTTSVADTTTTASLAQDTSSVAAPPPACSVVTTTAAITTSGAKATSVADTTTASVISTSAAASKTTAAVTSSKNLQTFTGAKGAAAPPVTGPDASGRFDVQGNTFATVAAALQRSCDIQHNACADKANQTGDLAALDQNVCQAQATACNAAATGSSPAKAIVSVSSSSPAKAAATSSAVKGASSSSVKSTSTTSLKASAASLAVASTSTASAGKTLAGGNLQLFSGVAGGTEAPAVTSANGRFSVAGVSGTFADKGAAIQKSCDVQFYACSDKANKTGDLGTLDQNTCLHQQTACTEASP